jgi:hypothetical protein
VQVQLLCFVRHIRPSKFIIPSTLPMVERCSRGSELCSSRPRKRARERASRRPLRD